MQSSTILMFRSAAFPAVPGEDEETNPGVYGRALIAWIAQQLPRFDYGVKRFVSEDFGRLAEVAYPGLRLYVAASNTDITATEWRVFAFSEKGFLSRLRGSTDGSEAISKLMADLKRILSDNADITELREVVV